jgi:hypothetical protein
MTRDRPTARFGVSLRGALRRVSGLVGARWFGMAGWSGALTARTPSGVSPLHSGGWCKGIVNGISPFHHMLPVNSGADGNNSPSNSGTKRVLIFNQQTRGPKTLMELSGQYPFESLGPSFQVFDRAIFRANVAYEDGFCNPSYSQKFLTIAVNQWLT